MARPRVLTRLLLALGCIVLVLLGSCERLFFTPLPKEQGPQIALLCTILPIAGGTTLQVSDTRVGQSADFQLTIRNDGSSALQLTGTPLVQLDDPATPDQFSITAQPATSSLASGATVQFTLRFQPDSAGTKNATIRIESNDTDVPEFTLQLAGRGYVSEPKIAVRQASTEIANAGSVDFGATDVASTLSLEFTIRNDGTEDLSLTGSPAVRITDPADPDQFVVSQPPALITIAPGGSTSFQIGFTPTTDGDKSASVSIASNDPTAGTFGFTVTGHTPPPDIQVETESVVVPSGGTRSVGAQAVGGGKQVDFWIVNPGDGTLVLTGTPTVSLDDPSTPDQFSVDQPALTELPHGYGVSFRVSFAPTTTGTKTATVTILSNDPDEGTYQFALTGIATTTIQGHVTLSEALGASATAKVCIDTSYKASPAYSTTVDLSAGATGFDYTVDAVPDGGYFIWTYVDTNANAVVGDPGDHLGTYGNVDPNLTAVNAVVDWTHRSGFDISTVIAAPFNSVTDASGDVGVSFVDIVAGQCTVNWAMIHYKVRVLSIPDQLLFDNHVIPDYHQEYIWQIRLDLDGNGDDIGDFAMEAANLRQPSEQERLVNRADIPANVSGWIGINIGSNTWSGRAGCSVLLENDNTFVVFVPKYAHTDLKVILDTAQILYWAYFRSGLTTTFSDTR